MWRFGQDEAEEAVVVFVEGLQGQVVPAQDARDVHGRVLCKRRGIVGIIVIARKPAAFARMRLPLFSVRILMSWHTLIKDIPDYPKAGIIFKDITPLLADGPGFSAAIEEMAQPGDVEYSCFLLW